MYLFWVSTLRLCSQIHSPYHDNIASQRLVALHVAKRIQQFDESGLAGTDQLASCGAIVRAAVHAEFRVRTVGGLERFEEDAEEEQDY